MSDYPYKNSLHYKIRKRLAKKRRKQNAKGQLQNATWPTKQFSSCFQYSNHATVRGSNPGVGKKFFCNPEVQSGSEDSYSLDTGVLSRV
jgi:hypothetical protein